MKSRLLLLMLCIVTVAGCITHTPRPSEVKIVPSDRLHAFQQNASGTSTVTITRDAGLVGHGCYYAIFVDGNQIAEMAAGERATFHIPAGEHVLGTWNTGKGLCSYRVGKDRREISIILRARDVRNFRIITNPNSGIAIEPTTL